MSLQLDKQPNTHRRIWLFLPLAVLLSGCQLETLYGASERKWLWFVIPLLGFVILGSILIWIGRERQLRHWDLAVCPSEPSATAIFLWTIGVAAALALIFIVQNIMYKLSDDQKLWNIGFWLLGSIAGVAIALLVGLKLAEPKTA